MTDRRATAETPERTGLAPAPRRGSTTTPSHPKAGHPLLALQRAAGNRAVVSMLQRQVAAPALAPPPTVRPHLQMGDVNQMVGVAQQKLIATQADSRLVVDAEFGPATQRAVRSFRRAQGLPSRADVDDITWARLDALAPGGDVQADGSLSPVRGPNRPDPSSPAGARPVGGRRDVKPVLRKTSTGVAVAELHEKLNALVGSALPVPPSLAAADSIVFGDDTDAAVKRFQRGASLMADGVVGIRTWARLDRDAPGSTLGRTARFGTQSARGGQQGGAVNVDWALEPDRTAPTQLRVRVRYQFVDPDPPAAPLADKAPVVGEILSSISAVWNRFKAVETPLVSGAGRPDVNIHFDPVDEGPADQVVTLRPAPGPSTSREWFIPPGEGMDIRTVAAHEFGHHVGLQDEYQQGAADHQRQTGNVAFVGDVTGDAPPEQIARELGRALRTPPRAQHGPAALAVVEGHGLRQGAFAQQVASRYRRIWGISPVADCNRLIDPSPAEGPMSMQRRCTQPFLYNADNLMAGAEAAASTHRHSLEPRHVREYADIVARALGGIWEPAARPPAP